MVYLEGGGCVCVQICPPVALWGYLNYTSHEFSSALFMFYQVFAVRLGALLDDSLL